MWSGRGVVCVVLVGGSGGGGGRAIGWVCEMVIDIFEFSGADCKGDTKNSVKLDADYFFRVFYCGVCLLLIEYCEYMSDVVKCR